MAASKRSAAAVSSSSKRGRRGGGGGDGGSEASASGASDAADGNDATSPGSIRISPRQNEFSERTWWMVDMEQGEESGGEPSNQGATALVKRCMRVHGWTLEKARKVLTGYRQFLTLKKEKEDWDATILSPSLLVDQMWHQHILDVVNYCHDSMLLCGRVVGHNPDGALSGKAERDETTREALEERFPNHDKEIWGFEERFKAETDEEEDRSEGGRTEDFGVHIHIKDDQTGRVFRFHSEKSSKLKSVFDKFAARKGVPVSKLVFHRFGAIKASKTPEQLHALDVFHWDVSHSTIEIVAYYDEEMTLHVGNETVREASITVNRMTTDVVKEAIDAVAASRGVPASDLVFKSGGFARYGGTAFALGLTNDARVSVMSREEYDNGPITIVVRDSAEHETDFKVTGATKMQKIMDSFAAAKGTRAHSFRFLLDGEPVYSETEVASLELLDFDQIDCFLPQNGC
ncbi:hypothetical protein ACHAXT_012538 [Thalassiosira profunda]